MEAACSHFLNSLVAEGLNNLRELCVIIVTVPALTFVIVGAPSSPGVKCPILIESERVEISTVNLYYMSAFFVQGFDSARLVFKIAAR